MKAFYFKSTKTIGLEVSLAAATAWLAFSTSLAAQQNVFSRSDSGTGDWGSGNNPWFYQTSNNNQGDPDNNGTVRNDVFIGHNNNTTMSLNGRFYLHRDFTFQAAASAARTINNTTNGGFSFSRSLINASSATHVFNAPVGIDGNNAEIRADNASGGLTFNGSIFTNSNQVYFRGPGTITLAGAMTQGGNLVKQDSGTLVITGNANFSGGLFIDVGTLRLNRTVGGTGVIDIGSAAGVGSDQTATLEISSNIDISRSIRIRNEGTSPGTRQLNFTHSSGTATVSGGIELLKKLDVSNTQAAGISGTVTGIGAFAKSGTGVLTLSGDNNYTGATTVTAGTLVINGNQTSATGNVSVSGTLAGTGTVGGNTTISTGGTHSVGPGTAGSAGGQTFKGDLTYSSGSIFAWDLTEASTTTGFDKVTGSAGKTFQAAGEFRVISDLAFGTGFWDAPTLTWNTIFSSFTTLTGWSTPATVNVYGTNGSVRNIATEGSFNISGTTLTWTAVPEPSAAFAGLLISAGMLRRRRRVSSEHFSESV